MITDFLLHKYWTQEILDTYKKIGVKSFCKWRIPLEDVKKYLSAEGFKKLEKSEEKTRVYFFLNFFFAKLNRCGEHTYGVGIDPERKTKRPVLNIVQSGKIKEIK